MSAEMSAGSHNAGLRLNRLLVEAGMEPLDTILAGRFEEQLSLIIRWNAASDKQNLQTLPESGRN